MARLFGFSIEDTENKSPGLVSPVPPNNQDGSENYISSGFFGSYIDIEGVYKTENDLIRRYRQMALYPECDSAIEDIVNEAIVSDTNDTPVQIELSNLNASDNIKKTIREEFKYILELLDFDKKSHEIFRNWYIDGRLYYNKVIDQKNPHDGIQELRYVDASKMRFIRQMKKKANSDNQFANQENPSTYDFPEIEEYFLYNPETFNKGGGSPNWSGSPSAQKGVRMSRDSVTYCTSGLVDRNKGSTLSWLHKAIKPINQLMMIEDSLVIYRLSRAPERRIFYIDVGNLPKMKAEQYLRDVMNRYRNKLVYDANTGEIRDDKKFMSMMEDFWLPRREGGRGTEITTLPGGQNLGELADIEYFQKKLYRSLNVPESRVDGSGGFSLGRSSEIMRDEIKFSKFVGRMRKRFSHLFSDILRTQLLLKNVVTPEDWDMMSDHIQYDFLYDNHFAEMKDSELMTERVNLAVIADPYVGRYYSADYVRRKILRQTDEEIIEQDKLIALEIENGITIDPLAPMPDMEEEMGEDSISNMQDPELDNSATEIKLPKGGEI
tara:strand:- start:1404 stop:3053 length:1650 start_codon:yes stop_codon:yes gene_type:complete